MNLKKEKRDETTASRHMSYLTILGTYMTIFGTVLGLVLSWGQLRLAHIESERARRAEPLSYSLEAVDTHYQYEIQKDGASMSIPAPSTRLQVSHGSLHSITAICFDGTTMHELAQLPIQDSWDGCVVDVTMPPKAVIPEEGLIHDYFFLFLEPTEGEGRAGSDLQYHFAGDAGGAEQGISPHLPDPAGLSPRGAGAGNALRLCRASGEAGRSGPDIGLKNSTGSKREPNRTGAAGPVPACRWTAKPPKEAGELYGEGVKPIVWHSETAAGGLPNRPAHEFGAKR